MPMIDVTVPAGAIAPDTAAALRDELATMLLRAERAPDTEFFREVTWVYWHEVADGGLAIGGRTPGARFRVDITVPDGALSQRRKDQLIADVHAAVTKAAGLDPALALHVWTLIREVPDGNWGAAGQTVHYSDLQEISKAQRATSGTPAGG